MFVEFLCTKAGESRGLLNRNERKAVEVRANQLGEGNPAVAGT